MREESSLLLCEQTEVKAGYLSVCSGDSGPEEESSLCPEGRLYIWHNILLHLVRQGNKMHGIISSTILFRLVPSTAVQHTGLHYKDRRTVFSVNGYYGTNPHQARRRIDRQSHTKNNIFLYRSIVWKCGIQERRENLKIGVMKYAIVA